MTSTRAPLQKSEAKPGRSIFKRALSAVRATAIFRRCPVCRAGVRARGRYLFECRRKRCGAGHWTRSVLREPLTDSARLRNVLEAAGVPYKFSTREHHHVYVLMLSGPYADCVYVGMTGHHPYHRYLNHLRGHKSARRTSRHAIALLFFEGPMSFEKAKKREARWAAELEPDYRRVYWG